jgi:hypothetical protein
MRSALALGGFLALLATARPALAQTSGDPSYEAVVIKPEVEVRSGPTEKFYPTTRLRYGEKVRVLGPTKNDNKWLEILPPPGKSFSWIESKWVDLTPIPGDPRVLVVKAPKNSTVDVMAGSEIYGGVPNAVCGKVESGTTVVVLETRAANATPDQPPLVRIQSLPSEVRYIPADAVKRDSGIQTVSGNTGQTPPVAPVAPPAPAPTSDLKNKPAQWSQEVSLDKTLSLEQRTEALRLLEQLKMVLTPPGPAQGGIPIAQGAAGHPNNAAGSPGVVPGQLTSRPGGQQSTTMYGGTAAPAPAPGQPQWKWSAWGLLTKSTVQRDGQQMYVLSNNQGKALLYAVPEAGKTLDPYVNQVVALYGSVVYRSDEFIRMDFMTVSYVAPPQAAAR